jgi:hypothetical protein
MALGQKNKKKESEGSEEQLLFADKFKNSAF